MAACAGASPVHPAGDVSAPPSGLIARAAKTSVSLVHEADDVSWTRKNFDKRTLRRSYRSMFEDHIAAWRGKNGKEPSGAAPVPHTHVRVCVRKRPIFDYERQEAEFDVVTARGGTELVIHNCLTKIDLKALCMHHLGFRFAQVFDDDATEDDVYSGAGRPAVDHFLGGGISTIFMFGQTGSGKTHTMDGLLRATATQIFGANQQASFSAFEIVGKTINDLLAHSETKVSIMQDGDGRTNIVGLSEQSAQDPGQLLELVSAAKAHRVTRATQVHAGSSRSHAVYRISLCAGGCQAVLNLVDCAGTERKEDSSHHNEESRKAAAEINSSLFALKECFRALRAPGQQPPFRESFLTRVLAESFSADGRACVVAIGTVSPSSSDTEHSLATLRALQQLQGSEGWDAKEDVAGQKQRAKAEQPHPRKWSEDDVRAWLSEAVGGQAQLHCARLSKGTDGKGIVRWTAVRFTQLCGGDSTLGNSLYQDLREKMKAAA